MTKKKILELVILSVLHFLSCIFSGALGWDIQTVLVSAISVFSITYCSRRISDQIFINLITITPFFLIYIISSINSDNNLHFPVWICGILVSVFAYIFLRLQIRPVFSILILLAFLFFEFLIIYPNYFNWQTTEINPKKYTLLNSKIVDVNNNEIDFNKLKGKVLLFDVWHSACLPCIERFPEIQNLYDYYKSDTSVKIVSLNFPLEKDKGIKPAKFTEPYSFEKMYFLNEREYEKFSDIYFPLILIMDKNMKCYYAGGLNLGWNIFIGNAKRIINKLKKKNE